jgi:antitoxin (DNA-binding transcriptional repressor) of toxin-antitoxin stability system
LNTIGKFVCYNRTVNHAKQKEGVMVMQQVTIDVAKAHLPDLIEAALNGVEVVIEKDEPPVVKLVPVSQSKPRPKFGSAKGLITISDDVDANRPRRVAGSAKDLISMSDDFDEPLEDFKEYM